MTSSLELASDQTAQARLTAVRPTWCAVRRVADIVSGDTRTVFHAGPPFESAGDIPPPLRHSICVAGVYEGWADDFAAAARLLDDGAIQTASAQDHGLLVPLAGVLSPGMAVLEVRDAASSSSTAVVHVAINEGQAHATRLGLLDAALPNHLRWLNGPFADWLAQCVRQPLALAPLMAQALRDGDDCHARTVAGSRLLAKALLRDAPTGAVTDAARDFIAVSPAFALNPWMAAAALWLRAAEGVPGCSWVSRAGGNGLSFGVQLAGQPGRWITSPAPVPAGTCEPAHAARHAIGALGDSAVVDFLGLGGQALAHAPILRNALEASLPDDVLERPHDILAAPGVLDGLARSVTNAQRCVRSGCGPLVLIGMIDAAGEAGRIGAGVVDVPVALFRAALASLPS
ncbi:MAG: DUF1116 domain-containing protein [Rhodoferax sp.]|nr:DUF1116 domain-containing protein [Rhodoferax sp.]